MAGHILKFIFYVTIYLVGYCHANEDNTLLQRLENLEILLQKQNDVIDDQKEQIGKLSKVNEKQDKRIFELEKQRMGKENTHSMLEKPGDAETPMMATYDDNDSGVKPQFHDQKDKRVIVPQNKVAFTAYYDHDDNFMPILRDGETVVFNRVLYNAGNSYNAASGIFACRYSGVYLFSLSIGTNHDNAVAKIVIDGRNQVDTIAEGEQVTGNLDAQGSATLITHVNEGENVWVIQYFETDAHLRGSDKYRFTSFSGVLLFQ